jgi:glycosyltransferase involved in cell wall biosynthesis
VLILAEYQFKSGEKLTADRITIRDLYLIGDILFMPSYQEGFGIPLLEAGMIKMPIVCSDIPPFREIGGDFVYYFKPDASPESIAEGIIHFVEQIPSNRHFRKVINEYTWDNIFLKKLEPFLKNIIQSK